MANFQTLEKEIIAPDLCTYCGTCVGICPTQTLAIENGAIVNAKNSCINCGKCVSSCPGKYFDYAKYETSVCHSESAKHPFIGNYYAIYTGHSLDASIRAGSSSGGGITELLLYLIRTKFIDAVLVTKMDSAGGATPIITADESIIIQAAQSKYCPSPTNKILKQILDSDRRIAYVGLPCQVQGLKKAMGANPILKKRIPITIGLFCGFNMTMDATYFLIKKSHIPLTDIQEISYRKKINGTTGFFIRGTQKTFFVEKHGYTFLNLFFSPKRCLKCYDYTAEFADISFGDAWEKGLGWSRIICRTPESNKLIQDMAKDFIFKIQQSDVNEIAASQKSILSHKKVDFWIRKKCLRNFPEYNIEVPYLTIKEKVHGIIMTAILVFAHSKPGLFLLYHIPFHLFTKLSKTLRK